MGTRNKIKVVLLSRCYLRTRMRLSKLGEKNGSLIIDIKNAKFMCHRKANIASVLKSAWTG